MKLVIGLGNPGKAYARTRHNVGFMMIEMLAQTLSAELQEKAKFHATIATAKVKDETIWLVQPNTFYNLVGQSVRAIRDFYKLSNQDILVIYDDMALPFGTIRSRSSGTPAGNNGIKSLNEHLGENYGRIRIGTWSNHREQVDAPSFVLGAFTANELKALQTTASSLVKQAVLAFLSSGELAAHTSTFNVRGSSQTLAQAQNPTAE